MTDRRTHWQNIYREKSPSEVSWYQKKPQLSLDLIHDTGVNEDDAIIDIGGGASVLVDFLCRQGFRKLAVLDISGNALATARKRLGDMGNNIDWFETDITEFNPPHQFLFWHDRAVFHFLTDESDRRKYVSVLKRALLPGGHIIIAAFAIGGPEKCSGLDIVQYDASKLSAELGDEFQLLDERNEIHVTPANKQQAFTYFHFVKENK
jgi:SAM-dependent methyltransferase